MSHPCALQNPHQEKEYARHHIVVTLEHLVLMKENYISTGLITLNTLVYVPLYWLPTMETHWGFHWAL